MSVSKKKSSRKAVKKIVKKKAAPKKVASGKKRIYRKLNKAYWTYIKERQDRVKQLAFRFKKAGSRQKESARG